MEKETLGQRLRSLRKEKDLTQIELANELKIDKSTIAKYETDKIEPSLSMLVLFLDYFNVSADYLLGRED